jgi:hypothetical protein
MDVTRMVLRLSGNSANARTIDALVLTPMRKMGLELNDLGTHYQGTPLQTHERLAKLCDTVIRAADDVPLAVQHGLIDKDSGPPVPPEILEYATLLKGQYLAQTASRHATFAMLGEVNPVERGSDRGAVGMMPRAQRLQRILDGEEVPGTGPRGRLIHIVLNTIHRASVRGHQR